MCVLCNSENLRLLVAPLRSLSYADVADAIQVAREAAMQYVFDAVDALPGRNAPDTILEDVGSDAYAEYVIERAERDGVADAAEVREWMIALREHGGWRDARVQAFLSSSTEGLAVYLAQIEEKQALLERFIEVPAGSTTFSGIGAHGEISFEYADDQYVVLSEEEAMQITVDRTSRDLWQEDPARLLLYSGLPDDAVEILAAAQQNPPEKANDILLGIVDVSAVAEDHVRQHGYGVFIAEGITDDYTEQRFGDSVIIRLHPSDTTADDE